MVREANRTGVKQFTRQPNKSVRPIANTTTTLRFDAYEAPTRPTVLCSGSSSPLPISSGAATPQEIPIATGPIAKQQRWGPKGQQNKKNLEPPSLGADAPVISPVVAGIAAPVVTGPSKEYLEKQKIAQALFSGVPSSGRWQRSNSRPQRHSAQTGSEPNVPPTTNTSTQVSDLLNLQ
jgi:hypothetical protein